MSDFIMPDMNIRKLVCLPDGSNGIELRGKSPYSPLFQRGKIGSPSLGQFGTIEIIAKGDFLNRP